MSDEAEEQPQIVNEITFNIKSSSDSKYVITVPENITVLELKKKLATDQYANVESDRQRLIYSGRVLKDTDVLSVYKIKDGNTVHMVKGAASNARQNPGSSASSVPPSAGVPTNLSTGTGTDPLAGLTGARYAGFAQLPGAEQFGADGGMGAPQAPDDLLRQLDNPMFASQMNEAMNNPHIIQMMQNSPQIRNNPMLRQMLENPEMRRMLMNPAFIRQSIEMQRRMADSRGGGSSMPMPGVTDTTPQAGGAAAGSGATTMPGQADPSTSPFGMFGPSGGGGAGAGGQPNPFAALFGGGPGAGNPFGAGGNAFGATGTNPGATQDANSTSPPPPGHTPGQDPAANPLGGMFGNPQMTAMAQEMMQNPEMMHMAMQPEMMRMAMQNLGLGGAAGEGAGAGVPGGAANPFAGLFGPGAGAGVGAGGNDGGPFGMLGGGFGGQPAAPADTRPPEEQYADQLRQLNEMGFYEFDRNVRALRMAGGNVQGAVNVLLEGGV